jgi:hypothetical protein
MQWRIRVNVHDLRSMQAMSRYEESSVLVR